MKPDEIDIDTVTKRLSESQEILKSKGYEAGVSWAAGLCNFRSYQ